MWIRDNSVTNSSGFLPVKNSWRYDSVASCKASVAITCAVSTSVRGLELLLYSALTSCLISRHKHWNAIFRIIRSELLCCSRIFLTIETDHALSIYFPNMVVLSWGILTSYIDSPLLLPWLSCLCHLCWRSYCFNTPGFLLGAHHVIRPYVVPESEILEVVGSLVQLRA